MDRGIPDGVEGNPGSGARPARAGAVDFVPNDQVFSSLIDMGFSEVAAKKALFYTGNNSQEAAIEWIFANPNSLEIPLEFEAAGEQDSEESDGEDEDGDYFKMVFVVNNSLGMQTGKIAAQVAHAALGVHRILLQNEAKFGESLLAWNENGETKIVLKCDNNEALLQLEMKAMEIGLPCYLVRDAGRTQIPSGSMTVLGIFGPVVDVDRVTGGLRLL